MDTKNFSQLQETEKEEMIKKIQQEIENLEKKEELNQQQKERLSFLLSQLRELNDIPEFDVKTGWENFKRDYLPIAEEFLNRERERKQNTKSPEHVKSSIRQRSAASAQEIWESRYGLRAGFRR